MVGPASVPGAPAKVLPGNTRLCPGHDYIETKLKFTWPARGRARAASQTWCPDRVPHFERAAKQVV